MTDNATKEKILKAMYDLVAEKGYDKASIGQLAEAVGMQKASIYYYFKSKEDIFMTLVRGMYEGDEFEGAAPLREAGNAKDYGEALAATGERFIDTYFEHPALRKVYAEIDIQTTRIPALKDFMEGSDRRFHRFLQQCIDRGAALGAFPPNVDGALTAQILYTLLIGIDQAVLYELPVAPKAVWRAVVTGLLTGGEGR